MGYPSLLRQGCQVPGCTNSVHCRAPKGTTWSGTEVCTKHYKRLVSHGSVDLPKKNKTVICGVPDCARTSHRYSNRYGMSLCGAHWKRLTRYGDIFRDTTPGSTKGARLKGIDLVCNECGAPYVAKRKDRLRCDACAKARRRQESKHRKRKQRGEERMVRNSREDIMAQVAFLDGLGYTRRRGTPMQAIKRGEYVLWKTNQQYSIRWRKRDDEP